MLVHEPTLIQGSINTFASPERGKRFDVIFMESDPWDIRNHWLAVEHLGLKKVTAIFLTSLTVPKNKQKSHENNMYRFNISVLQFVYLLKIKKIGSISYQGIHRTIDLSLQIFYEDFIVIL